MTTSQSLPPDLFARPVETLRDLAIVTVIAGAAIGVTRFRYAPHRHAEFSELSAERIAKRKSAYEWARWLGFIAVLCAFLRFCHAFD